MLPKVFISYARLDGIPLAHKLTLDLRQRGFQVFWDCDNILPGENWRQTLAKALEGTTDMLVILTPCSVQSEEVAAEWESFLDKGKRIIPLLYLECEIPYRLSQIQRIDFQLEANYQANLEKLLETLKDSSSAEKLELAFDDKAAMLKKRLSYIEAPSQADNLVALCDLGFYGLNIDYYMQLIFGEWGRVLEESPYQFEAVLDMVTNAIKALGEKGNDDILDLSEQLQTYVLEYAVEGVKKPHGWAPASELAYRIIKKIANIELTLHGSSLAAYGAGRWIGRWNRLDTLSSDVRANLIRCVEAIIAQDEVIIQIIELMENYESLKTEYPFKVYKLVRQELIADRMNQQKGS